MIRFSSLTLENWRQFDVIDVDLTKQITILTGQNGCGKTTLLNILSRHFGWSLNFVSTPRIGKKIKKRFWSDFWRGSAAETEDVSVRNVGQIAYSEGHRCTLTTKTIVNAQYQLDYANMQTVAGMHIPSHRPVAAYNSIATIPTDPKTATQEYQSFQQLLVQFYGGGKADNPGKIQKQSIISLAVFGEGNSAVLPNSELKSIFDEFQVVLRKVMPAAIGFQRLEVRMPEVVCITDSGDFALDAMSGGINSLFSIAWQIYMFGHDKESFTVTIDEPENHLHPTMQRTLLPSLASAFPKCSFIVATHSPFVVSSFPDASIYALTRNSTGRIGSQLLNLSDVSGTPNDVLREILDVGSNLPLWVEQQISDVISKAASEVPERRADSIMKKLEELGFSDAIVEYKRSAPDAKGH